MGKPAARLTDMHTCPMVTPGLPPIPHVGGPIVGPGCPTVLIGGMPAAVMGDMCTCVGPPDTIILGSAGVLIGGKPAARMGDQCAHGGAIVVGCPTVLIGEVSPVSVEVGNNLTDGMGGLAAMPAAAITNVMNEAPPQLAVTLTQVLALKEAAENGNALVHNPKCCSECEKKMAGVK
jgi:uncharacterized Zn-binding protein involved in type VI secretion